MLEKKHYQLLILGSGPAGCTAAIYAARANLNFAVITGPEQGGQITKTPKIDNWPGEPEGISGTALMEKMLNQAKKFNSNVLLDSITKADLSKRPFHLWGGENEYTCDALIIATGASPKFLGLPSEQQYLGHGVSTCAVCDGFFYKNKKVAIIGGGNTTAEEALYLAKIASSVTVIHRRDAMRAEAWLIDQLQKTPNIKFALNHVVTEILGNEQGVTGINIQDVNSQAIKTIEADGVFIAIGHKPNTEIFSGQLEMEHDYIKIGYGSMAATSIEGIFAAGDVASQSYHQAIIAAGSGAIAALDAKNYLATLSHHISSRD